MSTSLLARTPPSNSKAIAQDLFLRISDIERAIASSEQSVRSIENRPWYKSVLGSTRGDLVHLTKSQNQINDLMLQMVNDIIALNVMSYSALFAVMTEFEQAVTEGLEDSSGRVVKLGTEGRRLAQTASEIFQRIVTSSKDTQDRIELNATQIQAIRERLKQKEEVDLQQTQQISALSEAMVAKNSIDEEQFASIEALRNTLAQKNDLDSEQSARIESLNKALVDLGGIVQQQMAMIRELDDKARAAANGLTGLSQSQDSTNAALGRLHGVSRRLRAGWIVSVTGLALALAVVTAKAFAVF